MPSLLKWLIPLIVFLALITAGTGLFAQGGQGHYTFETVRGDSVEMYGHGIYQHGSLLVGAGFRGTDAIALLTSLPLLVIFYLLAWHGSQNVPIAMTGVLKKLSHNRVLRAKAEVIYVLPTTP